LFEEAGVNRPAARKALSTLAEGTLANIRAEGIAGALTGPIERGDAATVRRHSAAIDERLPSLNGLQALLGRLTVEIAAAKGSLDEMAVTELMAALVPPRRSR
jgi:predicted short-subunit dehydrogenase-like oxidoreductase (DUF2520 family)